MGRAMILGCALLCGCAVPGSTPVEVRPAVPGDAPSVTPRVTPPGPPGLDDRPAAPPGPPIPCPLPFQRPTTVFADVTACAGFSAPHEQDDTLFMPNWASGQAWGDVDGDGDLDAVVTGVLGGTRLLRNLGLGRFEPASGAGLHGIAASGATLLDADNDGDLDLHLVTWGLDRLLLNDGAGRFSDPPGGTPFTVPGLGSSAAWADWDEDGDLDPYTVNYLCYGCEDLGDTDVQRASDVLWQAGEDGGMGDRRDLVEDPQLLAGLGFQAVWFDADDDGDLDLLIANDRGQPGEVPPDAWLRRNVYLRNDGPGCGGWCFTEAAEEVGLDSRLDAMGVAVGDVDGDLDLDLFITDTRRGTLLVNEGGKFVDGTLSAGLGEGMEGWGCAFLDYDNDGWLDLYVAGGTGLDDTLFHNDGDGTFTDLGAQAGANAGLWSLGVATGDYDGDGAVDLLVADAGDRYRLHRNLSPPGRWLGLRLLGQGVGGRDAVGARAYVTTEDGRVQVREVSIGGSIGSGSDTGLHFGLGGSALRSVRIRWPDGVEESVDVPGNAWSEVARGAQ